MSWETQFKVAIVERDPQKIIEAFEGLPPLEGLSYEKMRELYDYLEQGVEILKKVRRESFVEMDKMKKVRQFLKTDSYAKRGFFM